MSRDLVAEKKNYEKRWKRQHHIFFCKHVQHPFAGSTTGNEQHPGTKVHPATWHHDSQDPRILQRTKSFSFPYVSYEDWVYQQDSLLTFNYLVGIFRSLICRSYLEQK